MTSTRGITYIAGAILGLVIVAAVVVLLAEGRTPNVFPAGSPQAAMRAYLAAWEQRDVDAAYGFFSTAVQANTSQDEYRRAVDSFGDVSPGDEAVFIDAANVTGDSTTLHLTVEHYYGGGPGSEVFRDTREVRMVREADGWKIDEALIGVESIPFDGAPL